MPDGTQCAMSGIWWCCDEWNATEEQIAMELHEGKYLVHRYCHEYIHSSRNASDAADCHA